MAEFTDWHKEKIKEMISEFADIPEGGIQDETLLKDGLGLDSLDIVELMMKFETEFDCSIPDEDYAQVRTVGDVFKIVEYRI